MNPTCLSCDYINDCSKTIKINNESVLAKKQTYVFMNCLYVVEDLCRDCKLFKEKKCASWYITKGKKKNGKLVSCPKRV